MNGLILGIDLGDDCCRVSGMSVSDQTPKDVSFAQADGRTIIQTTLGKKRDVNEWFIGKEAYEAALTGEGMIVDKLLTRLLSGEKIQVEDKAYTGQEMMCFYLLKLLECVYREFGVKEILKLVISVEQVHMELIDALMGCMDALKIDRERLHIVCHTECFLYYVLTQKKEYWMNESVLFDWSGRHLHYYELNVSRGMKPVVVRVNHQILEDDLSAADVNDEHMQKVADSLLASYAQKLIGKRLVSSVLLSGSGLECCQEWKKNDFLQVLCSRRHVYVEPNVYSRGAAYIGMDEQRSKTIYPYSIVCEGRLQSSLEMEVLYRGVKRTVTLARQGSSWYEERNSVDLILDNMDSINIRVIPPDGKLVRIFSIPLDNFPKRPARTTRVQVILSFASEHEAVVRIVDKGFGDLFPASGAVKKSKIMLT